MEIEMSGRAFVLAPLLILTTAAVGDGGQVTVTTVAVPDNPRQVVEPTDAANGAEDRRTKASEALSRAEQLLVSQDLVGAVGAANMAEDFGADVGSLKARITAAREAKGAEHLSAARALLKRGKVDDSGTELARAAALGAEDQDVSQALLEANAQRAWKDIARKNDEAVVRAFVADYGETKLGAVARVRLQQLEELARKEAEFRQWFPPSGQGYEVKDVTLFFAVALNDALTFAEIAVPGTDDKLKGKRDYARDKAEKEIVSDPATKGLLAQFRTKLSKATVYLPIDRPSLEYDKDYFLRTCEPDNFGRADRVTCSSIAFADAQDAHQHLSAAKSQRYSCYSVVALGHVVCGLRLNGMPTTLKETLSGDSRGGVKTRWRWSGLETSIAGRSADPFGVAAYFRAPTGLSLEFIDSAGEVLWTAK